ncbi:uncharacterized protein si:dkey-52l18.4 [Osmerus mordax]|uniref:uncharacterized protein si:dkey-52l18.4 n=1 Tax=Osmerus mordax TaxID=8014 RepID=UPI00350EEC6B
MSIYLFFILACPCLIQGLAEEKCHDSVLARRDSVYARQGDSLSLSCVVQHCGHSCWSGGWRRSTEGGFLMLKPTERHLFYNETLSANQTRLLITILNINQSDAGLYGCHINWDKRGSSVGHHTYVNVTEAIPGLSQRSELYRILVCVSILLCTILGLTYIMSKVKLQSHPQPPCLSPLQLPSPPRLLPRQPIPPKTKPKPRTKPKPKLNIELVYAVLSPDSLRQNPPGSLRDPSERTVYSSLRIT